MLVKVLHGYFWYHQEEKQIMSDGQEHDLWVERNAFCGEVAEVTREQDIQRGLKSGAFIEITPEQADNLAAFDSTKPQPPEGYVPEEDEEIDIAELAPDELVDWLMSTGSFDGDRKPNADEVVTAAGGDPDLAQRLLTAENTATGSEPRKTVSDGLNKVINTKA